MASVSDVLEYLEVAPPEGAEELVRALTIVYLADWKAAIELGRQITGCRWWKAAFGPFSDEFLSELRSGVSGQGRQHAFTRDELAILDGTDAKWRGRSTREMLRVAMSTYPMLYGGASDSLDLSALALQYAREFRAERQRVLA